MIWILVYLIGYLITVGAIVVGCAFINEDKFTEKNITDFLKISFFWPVVLPILICAVIVHSVEEGCRRFYRKYLTGSVKRLVNWLNSFKED